jgi:hypothetical protein
MMSARRLARVRPVNHQNLAAARPEVLQSRHALSVDTIFTRP